MTNSELTVRIAKVVRDQVAAQGMSVNGLAAATGIPFSTLSRRVSGKHPFTTEELGKVAVELGTTFTALVACTADAESAA